MNRGKRYAVLCIGFMTVLLCLGILLPVPERVRAAEKSKGIRLRYEEQAV